MLTPDEFHALLAELTAEPYRTMVILAGCLGLGRSEIVGLKWADIDWGEAVLSVQRGVVHCHVGNPKTLARRKPIPLAPELLTVLREHRDVRHTGLIPIGFLPRRTNTGRNPIGRTRHCKTS